MGPTAICGIVCTITVFLPPLNESERATIPVMNPEQHAIMPSSNIPVAGAKKNIITLSAKKTHQGAGELPPEV